MLAQAGDYSDERPRATETVAASSDEFHIRFLSSRRDTSLRDEKSVVVQPLRFEFACRIAVRNKIVAKMSEERKTRVIRIRMGIMTVISVSSSFVLLRAAFAQRVVKTDS